MASAPQPSAESSNAGQRSVVPKQEHQVFAEDSLALLKALAEASGVFIALTFIGGWSYLASYYKTFGLNALDLDVPVPIVSTLAIYVLYSAKWPLFVAAALVLARAIFYRQLRPLRRRGAAAVLGLLLLIAATAGVIRGRQLAIEDALLDSNALPYVAFASKLDKIDQPSCVEFQTYGSLDCKLLLHSKGTYYFFLPVPRVGEGSLTDIGSMNLYTLSDSEVVAVHIQRGLGRNARIE